MARGCSRASRATRSCTRRSTGSECAGPATVLAHGHYGGVAEQARPVGAAAAREALGIPPDTLVVLMFGVLRPDKGLGDLLTAAIEDPTWHLLIAGKEDGALHAEREALRRPELTGRVTIREGFHEIDTVAMFFAAADLVALPYRQASQSGVLHLAYGFGRPVVAYRVGGLVEGVIDGETGWLCAEPTQAALAGAIAQARRAGREELRATRRGGTSVGPARVRLGRDRRGHRGRVRVGDRGRRARQRVLTIAPCRRERCHHPPANVPDVYLRPVLECAAQALSTSRHGA